MIGAIFETSQAAEKAGSSTPLASLRSGRNDRVSLFTFAFRASLLLFSTVLALAAPAAAKSWRISNFQDTITVNEDGSALVNETITLAFDGEWHGIRRSIPIEYPGPDGTNYQLFIDITSITDESGAKLKYDSSTSGAYRDLKIYIPNAVDAARTVEIAYRVRNGTRFFDDHDEFYWNVMQRLACTHRSRLGQHSLPRWSQRIAARASLHRRLRLDRARCNCEGGRRSR